jgi:hypothetical protein
MNRTMKTPALATVYLDNQRIGLMGDPRPRVSKIVASVGKRPESVQVLRGQSATDLRGKPLLPEDVIDRTSEPTKPIYLTSKPHAIAVDRAHGGMHEPDPSSSPVVRRTPPPVEPEPEWDP